MNDLIQIVDSIHLKGGRISEKEIYPVSVKYDIGVNTGYGYKGLAYSLSPDCDCVCDCGPDCDHDCDTNCDCGDCDCDDCGDCDCF